jgi:pimeloyl-ACP methyl ester carboxylesterase
MEDVMRRLRETEQVPGGAVRIERWTGEDGVTRRIVYIPGTQDWLNISGNPFDSQADLELAAGNLPDAAGLVAAALKTDGARPGEPVMLAGHSLGGMLATALAANPALTSRFTVQAVVTAGSPVGRIALPSSVNALHLEGTRDIVPGLDGRPNPDTPTRTTVHHDARDSQLPELAGEGEDIGSAHHLDTYAQTARLVDEGLSPSTDAWLSAEREFLQPGADVVVTEYRP